MVEITGYDREDESSMRGVETCDFDDYYGLLTIDVPYSAHMRWHRNRKMVEGQNYLIGSTIEDISNFNQNNNYAEPLTAIGGFKISSTSSLDTDPSGSGINAVRISYLDANWNEATCDVALSGTKQVTVPNSMLRVNKLEAVRVSTSACRAVGNITLASGGTPYLRISAGETKSYGGYYYVPTGQVFIITDWNCYPLKGSTADFSFELVKETKKTYNGKTYTSERSRHIGDTVATYTVFNIPPISMPHMVEGCCRVRIRGQSQAGGGSGGAWLRGYLVDRHV